MTYIQSALRRLGYFSSIAVLLLVNVLTIGLLVSPKQAEAAVNVSFSDLGTHPQAAAQSTSVGKTINKVQVFSNKVYAAYGDYLANTGPIAINPYNLNTNSFSGTETTVSTESLGNWKIINGKLYTTTLDATCSGSCPSGYAVGDSSGAWQLKMPVNAEHVFDIETLTGTDIWLFGGSTETAIAWRSTDNGTNWVEMETSNVNPGSDDSERYYWGANINGTMYMQAEALGQTAGVQSYDGASSSTGTSDRICRTGDDAQGPNPVVFNDKVLCSYFDHLYSFDGTDVDSSEVVFSDCDSLADVNVTGDYFQVLCYKNGTVSLKRSADLETWQTITGLPATTSSFTIDASANKMYVGTTNSKLYAASLPAPDVTAPSVVITSPTSGTSASSFTVTTNATDNIEVTKVEFYMDGTLIGTRIAAPFSYAWYNQYGENDWEVAAGSHSLTAKAYDFENNSMVSSAVPITLTDPDIVVEPHSLSGQALGSNVLAHAPDGAVWLADTSGLFDSTSQLRIGKVGSSGQVTYYDPQVGIVALRQGMMTVDSNNTVWFVDCAQEKVFHFDPETTEVDEFAISSVCHENVANIAVASDGTAYVAGLGTDLHKINAQGTVSTVTLPANTGVTSLATTHNGGIVMNLRSTQNSVDSSLARITSGAVQQYYTSNSSNPATYIAGFGITVDRNGTTWATSNDVGDGSSDLVEVTSGGALTRHTLFAQGNDTIYALQLAENGDLWMSSHLGFVTRFVPSSGYATHYRLITPASEDMFGPDAAILNETALGYYALGITTSGDGNVWVGDAFGSRLLEVTAVTDEPPTSNSNEVELTNAESGQSVSLQTPVSTQITCSSTVRESSLAVQDNSFNYPLGLINFCFTTNQQDNEVTLTFVTDLKPNKVQARKYNSDTKTYADIARATITETSVGGKAALRVTYSIADNGTLDLDPITGQIKDPVGLAVGTSSGSLAATGARMLVVVTFGGVALILGTLVVNKRKPKRVYRINN